MTSNPVAENPRWSSVHLDAIRGLAAVVVLVHHIRALFFVEYGQLHPRNTAVEVFNTLTSFGRPAVMVFFVLSGYLIAGTIRRALQAGKWNWRSYALNRWVRLQVVLIPALLLGAFWDVSGLHFFGNRGIYGTVADYLPIMRAPVVERLTLTNGLGNLLFLQGIHATTFGSNGALWSLSFEFWYYVLFPLLLLSFIKIQPVKVRLFCFSLAVAILGLIGSHIRLYFLIWLMGAALAYLKLPSFTKTRVFGLVAILAFGLALLSPRLHLISDPTASDFVLAVAFSLLLAYVVQCDHKPALRSHLYRSIAQGLSQISYTLYLVHLPFLVFLNAWLIGSAARWQPTVLTLGWATLLGVGVLGYAYLIWLLAESKTAQVRRILAQRLKLQG